MDAGRALDQAFSGGLKVRGDEQRAVAGASLVMHASRTLDPAPFLERGDDLIEPALAAFRKQGRTDLELRVAMWLADGGRAVDVSPAVAGALRAYNGARAWAEGGGGVENLAWIRDVPREEASASILFGRLFDHALAAGEEPGRAAEAVLEAALADFPRASSYGLVFRAAALSGSSAAIDRTITGLGSVHPTNENAAGRKRLETLRFALALEAMQTAGEPLESVVENHRARILASGLSPHLGAALLRKGKADLATALLEEARAAATADASVMASAAFIARQAQGARSERDSTARKLLAGERGIQAMALVAGACDASRALRSAWPAIDAAEAVTGDSMGPLTTASARATFQKALFAAGGEAAAASADREAVEAMAKTMRGAGLAPGTETFLRAALADAAAHVAARSGDSKAYEFAEKLAARSRDRFERAKMAGRIAMEFVRATEVPAMPVRWLDPQFDGDAVTVS